MLPDICFVEFLFDGPVDGPEVHHHKSQVDSFWVLEGELEITLEGSVHRAGPGTLASVPCGVRHTFSNSRNTKVRVLNVHTPDEGVGDFLRRISG